MTRSSRIIAALVLALGLASPAAEAQQRILLVGSVQWTSANRVQLITDSGAAVNVDVSRLDQTTYTSLRTGDRVRILGYLAPDRIRVIAETLEPDVWSSSPQTS
jgi:hypothetical protein